MPIRQTEATPKWKHLPLLASCCALSCELLLTIRVFAQMVVLIRENPMAVLPKASTAIWRGWYQKRSRGRLRKTINKKGKKNSPAKSLSFPVSPFGDNAFSRLSFRRSTPMLRRLSGWFRARRPIVRDFLGFYLIYTKFRKFIHPRVYVQI